MSDHPEPLAAILAEMRKAVAPMICGRPKIEAVSIRDVLQWADRIEAAAEREREKDRQLAAIAESDEAFARCARCDRPERAHGNVAAMREALECAKRWLYGMLQFCDRRTRGEEIRVPALSAFGTVDRISAALAAPGRNCDRFATEDEAREAYWAYREPLEFNNKPFVAITEWLFAQAKGGDHA